MHRAVKHETGRNPCRRELPGGDTSQISVTLSVSWVPAPLCPGPFEWIVLWALTRGPHTGHCRYSISQETEAWGGGGFTNPPGGTSLVSCRLLVPRVPAALSLLRRGLLGPPALEELPPAQRRVSVFCVFIYLFYRRGLFSVAPAPPVCLPHSGLQESNAPLTPEDSASLIRRGGKGCGGDAVCFP